MEEAPHAAIHGPASGQKAAAADAPPAPPPLNATRPSFVLSGAAAPSLAHEARCWLMGIVVVTVSIARLEPYLSALPLSYLVGAQGGMCTLALALMYASPEAYRRLVWRVHLAAHIVLLGSVLLLRRARAMGQLHLSLAQSGHAGLRARLACLGGFLTLSGINSGVTALVFFKLPPVATAAAAAAWAALLASGNGRVCALGLAQHPACACGFDLLYRWGRPLVAPLEPMLLAAGVSRGHAARRCLCVLACLQFWVVAVGGTALVLHSQARSYAAWRAEGRRRDGERRKRQAEEWGFGLAEPSNSTASSSSSDSDSGSSGGSGGGSELWRGHDDPIPRGLPPAAKAAMAAGERGRRPWHLQEGRLPPAHHPADWQWVWAGRVVRLLRLSGPRLAALAGVAAAAGAWHQETFP